MFTTQALLALAAAGLSTAHYTLLYPEWRGNTFDDTLNYTQWSWPCTFPQASAMTSISRMED